MRRVVIVSEDDKQIFEFPADWEERTEREKDAYLDELLDAVGIAEEPPPLSGQADEA